MIDPDAWQRGLRYRAAYQIADDAARRTRGLARDRSEEDRRLEALRRDLLASVTDEDERDGIDDGLAGIRPRF